MNFYLFSRLSDAAPGGEYRMSQTWREKLTGLRAAGMELDLPLLLAIAGTHQFTPEEDQALRRTLVVNEIMAQNKNLRRHRAEALVKEAENASRLNHSRLPSFGEAP